MLVINTKAPDFSALDQDGMRKSLSDYAGKYLVLYFYPKDDTPGCTTEACSIRDNFKEFEKYAVVVGVSSDGVESHKKFAQKYQLPFTLLADTDRAIIKKYDAGGLFTKRISYIINPQGIVTKVYHNVIPSQHAGEILTDLTDLYGKV